MTVMLLLKQDDAGDGDLGIEHLAVGRLHLNLLYDIHALYDSAECREAPPIGISLAAEVELGLISDADEDLGGCRPGFGPRH